MTIKMDKIYTFEDYISHAKHNSKNTLIIVPIGCDQKIIYNNILKHSELIARNQVYVSEEDNDNYISYEKLNKAYSEYNNTVFFIDNIEIFVFYGSSLLKEKSLNSNTLILFINILNIDKGILDLIIENYDSIYYLYPKNFCVDIDINYMKKESIISVKQYAEYKRRYMEFKKLNDARYSAESTPSLEGILNVYLDKSVSDLSTISLDFALQRAPKFKTIILDILLKNKDRHFVKMVDGKEGIDTFVSVYEKLENIMKLVVIKSKDSYQEKIKRVREINNNNSPLTIITDYNFSDELVPSNISYYHLTDGGDKKDMVTIFDILKTKNYSGVYGRKLQVVNHVSVTVKGDLTVNNIREADFSRLLKTSILVMKNEEKKAKHLYLKGEEMFVT